MYEIIVPITFDAAHVLPKHEGPCRHLHGHTYRLELHIKGDKLEEGMLIDFYEVDRVMNIAKERFLDHCMLNESLQTDTPTCEFIAKWAFTFFKYKLHGVKIAKVSISEGKHGKVIYSE